MILKPSERCDVCGFGGMLCACLDCVACGAPDEATSTRHTCTRCGFFNGVGA